MAKAAGLEGVTAHTLRHTHITWLVAAGVPTRIAAQRVGQTELLTRTYAHPGPREHQAAVTAVEHYRNNPASLARLTDSFAVGLGDSTVGFC